ncbi:glycosyltransferase [Myroides odoratimimus]|uniref:glycosyltransferase n=1 Tax=Myroides odoratimimus TaxID=76832 RepID=UPI00257506C5|nr:glycosyltransferase [Myroides odoratimimus]MDM1415686.1 glycosyltransferase [Myroides odoratimimus]
MNVGIVTTWFERGAAYVSKQMMDVLKKQNNVFIYSRGGEIKSNSDNKWNLSNVHYGKDIWLPTVTTPIAKKDFYKWIKNNNIEVVIFNEQHWLEPVIWCNEWNVKTIAYVDYYKNSTIKSFELYGYLICNTKRHFSVFNWHSGAKLIPWGTDNTVFKKSTITQNVIFHSIGMSPYRKGTDLLLKAYFQSNRKLKLVLHCQVDLMKLYHDNEEIVRIINSLLDSGDLKIVCETVSAPGLYHLGEFYIYPSRLDGIGLTVAESIAMGLIPVVSDNAPMNEFVLEDELYRLSIEKFFCREDGYYWPIGEVNVDYLTETINRLSQLSYLEKEEIRNEYDKFFRKNLDWNKNSEGLLELVSSLKNKQTMIIDPKVKNYWLRYSNSGFNQLNKYIIKFNLIFRVIRKIIK